MTEPNRFERGSTLLPFRERVLGRLMPIMLLFGFGALLAASLATTRVDGVSRALWVYLPTYILTIGISLARSLPLALRAATLLAAIFVVSISELYHFGIVSRAFMFLTGCSVLAGVFFGLNGGMVATAVAVVTSMLLGTAYSIGLVPIYTVVQRGSLALANWIAPTVSFAAISGGVSSAIAALLRDLDRSVVVERRLIGSLRREKTALAHSLAKEARLVREIDHRVGNTLQLLESLTSLELLAHGDDDAGMRRLAGRISMLAHVHSQSDKDEPYRPVDAYPLVMHALQFVIRESGLRTDRFELAIASFRLTSDQAIVFGLLLYELLKAAFELGPDVHGTLQVTVSGDSDRTAQSLPRTRSGNARRICTVVLPIQPGITIGHRHTIATDILSALVAQLDGTLEWCTGEPPNTVLRFPLATAS